MKRLKTEKPEEKKRNFLKIIRAIICLIFMGTVSQIVISNSYVASGQELSRIQEKVNNYELQIDELRQVINSQSSLSNIFKKATWLGMTKQKSISYQTGLNIAQNVSR